MNDTVPFRSCNVTVGSIECKVPTFTSVVVHLIATSLRRSQSLDSHILITYLGTKEEVPGSRY